ncbi:GH18512 [Drosophila grimshawi]|uniref:GH18512 n=1 Tax=Drosophila grimshawi TaxID=7222 RepID=B4JID4_DROGR|nr:GH18512 [Drosophila grimshawi]
MSDAASIRTELPAESHQLLRKADVERASMPDSDTAPCLHNDYRWRKDSPFNRPMSDSSIQFANWTEPDRSDGFDVSNNVPYYSFKGTQPEVYSKKKDFIYNSSLVDNQLVLKKTCEWWFYKNKYIQNMSAHLRQHACFFIPVTIVLALIGLYIFLNSSRPSDSIGNSISNSISNSNRFFEVHESKKFNNDTDVVDWSDDNDMKSENDFGDNKHIADDNLSTSVTLTKIHNFSLNAEDLLYESKRHSNSNSSHRDATSAFSMTGTFRTKTSPIWDPHPEYLLNVFGQQLHLVLHQDTSFIPSETFRVIRILNNRTEESHYEEHYLGCYYRGYVEGDNQSAVAVSLCGGMTGYIKTGFGTMLIQPVNQTDSDENLHRVWRHSKRNPRQAVSDLELVMEALELTESVPTHLTRRKRHNQGNQVYTLEVLIAVDHTMMEFHKTDLKSYILTLLSIVSNIFADASIGNSIRISLVKLLELKDINDRSSNRPGKSEKLKRFCSFLTKKGYPYDTAMLITRDQICSNEREERCRTLGLAELGTVCKASACSIVQDNGLSAAFTIAHELGHILNMPHDDDDRCKQYNSKPGNNLTLHIMSSVMGDHMHPWSWSKCSRHYVSEFLEKMDKSCLEDTQSSPIDNLNTKLPGEIYSLDHQCQLIHGNQSTHCSIEADCRRLFCKASTHPNENCRSSNLPWADGTLCNNNRYWCQKGVCVPRTGYSLKTVHGGWGPWTAFTPCSLTCGGGVQESKRECNNPVPENGGKYCEGSRKKYRSCKTHPCPTGTIEPREQECYDQNGRNLKIPGISADAKWIPKYGLNAYVADKCKLYCRLEDDSAYFLLKDMVRDGTTCTVDSFDKCVNGICRPAGCDNELNSIAKLDKCGVCEGNNDTCEEHTGNVYVSDLLSRDKPLLSLYYVTTIPKGASNIVITQRGYPDQNYIVLTDDHQSPILNSDRVVTPYPKKYSYAGVTIDYNGSNSTIERVNTTDSWKLTRDLIVKIISIDLSAAKNQDTILITYTYTVDKPIIAETQVEIYRWQMQAWSNCDSLCQGTMHRQAACISTTLGLKVAPQFCDESAMPKPEYRNCNTDCILTLNTTSISECSAACGELGTREKTFNCIQTFTDIQRSNIVDMSFCRLKFEIVSHEQCRAEPCQYYPKINQRSVNYWQTGEWGECSDWCKMNRTVTCVHPYGNYCPPDDPKKPKEVRNCCHIKYTSEWLPCSVECGTGEKRKVQSCARVYKPEVPGTPKRKENVDESYCKALKVRKPTLRKTTKLCKINCRWVTSEWTQCSRDCDVDYQTRSVRCDSWLGKSVNERNCDVGKRPTRRKICSHCMKRQYKVISSCDCSGYQRRRILYYDSHMRRVASKPKFDKIKCTPPPSCKMKSPSSHESRGAQTCSDLQRMYRLYKDGEYTLLVRGRQMRIYCHQMNSLTPREYITVEPQENYSIYYEYKTRYIDNCPPMSRDHEYANDQNSGRTHFSKLRLNISDLRIIENDFEFAKSRGHRQALGSAGDCYSRNMNCPQGDFSISLDGTGFLMRPTTVWKTYGNRAVMQRASGFDTLASSRRAFCGGFCGHCSISPTSGLYLDVV